MMISSPRTRLYVDAPLIAGADIPCDEKRSHYLLHVLREREGGEVALFNGSDGEWYATLHIAGKKKATLMVQSRLREQYSSPDLWLLCTPLKQGRSDYVIQKVTELGVARICPVITQFTSIDKVNSARYALIAVEAAEQSERMDVPMVEESMRLDKWLGGWPQERLLVYGDESGGGVEPHALALSQPAAVLVGPEGGFSKDEFALLRSLPFTRGVTLGPRILRADTAAIALVTLVQSLCGDWQHKPAFRSQEETP